MSSLTPDQVIAVPAGELAAQPSEALFQIMNEAADLLAATRAIVEHLDRALELKYAEQAQALRLAAGKDTGVVHFKALEFEKLRGAQRMAEIGAAAEATWNTGALEALRSAVRSQGRKTGVRWADALSSSVRPVITYWFMGLFCAAKTAAFTAAVTAGAGWETAILHAWTEADQALWAGVLNFWFLGRTLDKMNQGR